MNFKPAYFGLALLTALPGHSEQRAPYETTPRIEAITQASYMHHLRTQQPRAADLTERMAVLAYSSHTEE